MAQLESRQTPSALTSDGLKLGGGGEVFAEGFAVAGHGDCGVGQDLDDGVRIVLRAGAFYRCL